jgi:beta-aspartyl-dipeptidase (metallo-type)
LVAQGLSLEQAVRPATSSPADRLHLPAQGRIRVGGAGDLLVVGAEGEILMVVARGRVLVEEGRPVAWGRFEPRQ